jgi:L-threonylcarbamoyladenylate synthase
MRRTSSQPTSSNIQLVAMPTDAATYARRLYATLRELDDGGFSRILVEAVPDTVEWLAIADRLRRAAAK